VVVPRRCIFIATTNNETYLKSQTGNRRFWPVKTGQQVDLDALRRDRDQLWAQAAQVEASGAALKLPETLWATAAGEQDRRHDPDPWDDILAGVKGKIYPAADGRGEEERMTSSSNSSTRAWRASRSARRIAGNLDKGLCRISAKSTATSVFPSFAFCRGRCIRLVNARAASAEMFRRSAKSR
jgi:hypothetical protein